ncbi:hypothetical protein EV191_105230 [Tamaricihabitans halophyticus]|uniref:Uncharacterized protein n=1 Tax=Tamaricihabitans halophyticus TaxID=1262583 RepID=A0A4V6NRC6_9PSEU|nr:hypothetical protein [Tamaricihabitans halophyticus]TCP53166.1 hypothetical protein EV191_105230 [Tamaricihabitans halophyticus]
MRISRLSRRTTQRVGALLLGVALALGGQAIGLTAVAVPASGAGAAQCADEPTLPAGYDWRTLPNEISRTLLPTDWRSEPATPEPTLVLWDASKTVRVQLTTANQSGSAARTLLERHETNSAALDDYVLKRFDDAPKNGYQDTAEYEFTYRQGAQLEHQVVRGWQRGDQYIQVALIAPERHFEQFRIVAERAFELEIYG